ncbi:hypothetical protein GF406_12305 [candidate division KSB1 bacterium]|nr:hypothetical protein [candidate division KSB1 bacterium]
MQKFLLLIMIACTSLHASSLTPLEKALQQDIQDYTLDNYSHIEAAFILSGARSRANLQKYLDWYDGLLATIEDFHLDSFDRIGSAAKVFSYLHSSWLLDYKERATTLINVIEEKRYNCVAGTILYNLVCSDLGWPTEAFETPTHTYTIFPNFTEKVMVENTTPMGFNIMENLHAYSQLLAQYYPQSQAAQIGLDRLYAYENSKGRPIDNTELLGLLAYNRAYFARDEGNYDKAYEYVGLAQMFNKDSRSNVNFEISLYNSWGKKLFQSKRFSEAFTIFADANYRYPKIPEFAQNCRTSFFQVMKEAWGNGDWNLVNRMSWEIIDLDILEEEDRKNQIRYLQQWKPRLRKDHQEQADELLKELKAYR